MRNVTCTSCGKHYDYDADDFCPKCGSYNPRRVGRLRAPYPALRLEGHSRPAPPHPPGALRLVPPSPAPRRPAPGVALRPKSALPKPADASRTAVSVPLPGLSGRMRPALPAGSGWSWWRQVWYSCCWPLSPLLMP